MDNPLTQAVYLPLLRKWIALSREQGIAYSIYWGTLLGQVRNQHIIPYDLDVDVVVGKQGLQILYELPKHLANCFYNDELKEAPPWGDGEMRLVVKRDLQSANADRYDQAGRRVMTQMDSCAFNGPLARLIIKAPPATWDRQLWHLDIDLFTALSHFTEYPRPDEVDELPDLAECFLEGLTVSRLKDPQLFLIRAYGLDYLTPDHILANGNWVPTAHIPKR